MTSMIKRSVVVVVLLLVARFSPAQVVTSRAPREIDAPADSPHSRDATRGLHMTLSEDGSVDGSFTKGTYTIYFEAINGEQYESPGDEVAVALDIRIMDQAHTPFLMQVAGTVPAARSWHDEQMSVQSLPVDTEDRRLAFAILPRAAESLKLYVKQHPAARAHVEPIIELMESVTLADLQEFNEGASSPSIGASAITTYNHVVTIKRKPAFDVKWELEHSALLLQIYSSKGALLDQFSTCNHSPTACATAKTMSTKCTKTFVKTNRLVYMWDYMCDYYGYKYGGLPGLHTCNTDTRQQYLSVKGSSSQNWGICSVPYFVAPACD